MVIRPLALSLLAAILLAGCGSSVAERQLAAQQTDCQARSVHRALTTRHAATSLQAGVTPVKALGKLGKPVRTATLAHAHGADLTVAFYPLSQASCAWLSEGPTFLPVIYRPGKKAVVMGYGIGTLKTLQQQGWQLGHRRSKGWRAPAAFTPTPWPWQSWDYSYLPIR